MSLLLAMVRMGVSLAGNVSSIAVPYSIFEKMWSLGDNMHCQQYEGKHWYNFAIVFVLKDLVNS